MYDKGVKYGNRDYHNDFMEGIKQADIPYHIGDEGQIYYPRIYQKKVDAILEHLNARSATTFKNPEHIDKVKSALTDNNIPYRLRKMDMEGNTYLVWEPEYNAQVNKIIKKLIYNNQTPRKTTKKEYKKFIQNEKQKAKNIRKTDM